MYKYAFRLDNYLTEVEREDFEDMTHRQQRRRALPDRLLI